MLRPFALIAGVGDSNVRIDTTSSKSELTLLTIDMWLIIQRSESLIETSLVVVSTLQKTRFRLLHSDPEVRMS